MRLLEGSCGCVWLSLPSLSFSRDPSSPPSTARAAHVFWVLSLYPAARRKVHKRRSMFVDNMSRRYAYVNFQNLKDAERAMDTLNYTAIKARGLCCASWSKIH